jgi:hypothetical protein
MNEVTVRAVNPDTDNPHSKHWRALYALPSSSPPHSFGLGPYLFRRDQAIFSFSVDRIPLSFACCPGDFCLVVLLLSF